MPALITPSDDSPSQESFPYLARWLGLLELRRGKIKLLIGWIANPASFLIPFWLSVFPQSLSLPPVFLSLPPSLSPSLLCFCPFPQSFMCYQLEVLPFWLCPSMFLVEIICDCAFNIFAFLPFFAPCPSLPGFIVGVTTVLSPDCTPRHPLVFASTYTALAHNVSGAAQGSFVSWFPVSILSKKEPWLQEAERLATCQTQENQNSSGLLGSISNYLSIVL